MTSVIGGLGLLKSFRVILSYMDTGTTCYLKMDKSKQHPGQAVWVNKEKLLPLQAIQAVFYMKIQIKGSCKATVRECSGFGK